MTLPQNVADAVRRCDQSAEDSPHDESNWYVVRAELYRLTDDLVAKDAEIADFRAAALRERRSEQRAWIAESRLAAANALLREVYDRGEDFAAYARIQSHLQGSGDEV